MKNKHTVIIGRFQRPTINPILDEFIEDKLTESGGVLILVGLAHIKATLKNPMDFETRKFMLQEAYPDATIGYIKDVRENEDWSANLDEQVDRYAKKNKVTVDDIEIFGGKETVLPQYTGDNIIYALPAESYVNENIKIEVPSYAKRTLEYRLAVCGIVNEKYPTAFSTVDVAVFKGDKLLLARKPNETLFRFIGGFVDPRETSTQAAIREVMEEANIDIDNVTYIDEFVIDDWRYRAESDSIKSTLFTAVYTDGNPTPQDDIEELRLFDVGKITPDMIVPEHVPLFNTLVFLGDI